MGDKRGSHLGKIFFTTFLLSASVIFISYAAAGFEIAILFSLAFLCAVVATVAVGIENTFINEIEYLQQKLRGYLLDIYAELLEDKN